ncbi:MAG: rRNA maturation RNase YbeY [Bacteroidales bacterium]
MVKVKILSDGVDAPKLNVDLLQGWIEAVARLYGRGVGEISYIFCNDEKILEVNRQYLEHDYYTDIITFDYSRPKRISGDMFISLDTVASNAVLVNSAYRDELLRVVIHGVLHLCGIKDKSKSEREAMESAENQALRMLPSDIL